MATPLGLFIAAFIENQREQERLENQRLRESGKKPHRADRKRAGIQQLARDSDVGAATIARLINDDDPPSPTIETLTKIASAMAVDVTLLIGLALQKGGGIPTEQPPDLLTFVRTYSKLSSQDRLRINKQLLSLSLKESKHLKP